MSVPLTIIIPAYQAEKYIKRAILSCVNQNFQAMEIIVINDGSTDDTMKIIRSIDDPRVKVVDKQNEGVGKARNDGLKEATGKYVMFLDADDYLPKGAVEKMLAPALNKEIDFVFSGYSVEHGNGLVNVKPTFNECLSLIDNFYIDNIVSSPWAKLFKLSVIREYSIKFESFKIMQDSIFNLRYLSVCDSQSFIKIDESLYVYNKLSEGTTVTLSVEKVSVIDESLAAQEKIYSQYYTSLGVKVNKKALVARRVLLQDFFVAQNAVTYPENRFQVKKLYFVAVSPFLNLKTKLEYVFFLLGERSYNLFLILISMLKRNRS